MDIGWEVRLLCPWASHLKGLFLHLSGYRLELAGGSLTRRRKVSFVSTGRDTLTHKCVPKFKPKLSSSFLCTVTL